MLAMRKVVEVLGLFPEMPEWVPGDERLWAVVVLSAFVLIYAGVAGLWGVVATDFFQFFLARFLTAAVGIRSRLIGICFDHSRNGISDSLFWHDRRARQRCLSLRRK